MNNTSDRDLDLTTEELEIIRCFAEGQKHALSSQNLKLEYSETSIRLSNTSGKLIGISKQANEYQRKVLVSNSSVYTSSIIGILADYGFVTRQKSSHPEFTEHHYYQFPSGYKLNYTEILQLWKVWWNNKRHQLNVRDLPINVLIFSKGDWYPIKNLQPQQGNFSIEISRGELTISAEDYVVWIDKVGTPPVILSPSSPSASPLTISPTTTASELSAAHPLTEVTPLPMTLTTPLATPINDRIDRLELPEVDEDIDLEYYLSTFNTEDTEDIDRIEGIYNIKELLGNTVVEDDLTPAPLPTPKPPFRLEVTVIDPPVSGAAQPAVEIEPNTAVSQELPANLPQQLPISVELPTPELPAQQVAPNQVPVASISQRKRSLKLKAINALTNYLQEGDSVTLTEVLKNGRGEVINRKVTTVRHGCPNWAIDRAKEL